MSRLFDLSGRTALITGGSRGIGHAIAQALTGAGARVVINGRSADALAQAAQALRVDGAQVDTAAFDVCDSAAVTAGIADIESRIGPIDILVNNAGIQRRAPLDQFADDDWHALMDTNLNSVFYVSRAVAQGMLARGRGKIINIASVQSELARPNIAPYTASKGAIRNLTRGMCADWAARGLQINAIAPGYFDTPLNKALVEDPVFDAWLCKRTPAGRWGRLEDLHGAAVFLASSASDFVNGQTIFVDGGIVSVI
ncbi:SDR family oxidoreductase [Novosphingobium sp. FSY-8]|uniref:SDR family oxidoreductase n=1 Tax=Novosphingobium ovatum TaxID=1908523 RepID=A0ABW9XDM2_9SPHN|nr:SDR family oxidoreductase [Novosphingobium ovatum]NBC36636.1 SDR family oxidoreductase [Novosphingobium ovatum]